jgi:hypothetical protein
MLSTTRTSVLETDSTTVTALLQKGIIRKWTSHIFHQISLKTKQNKQNCPETRKTFENFTNHGFDTVPCDPLSFILGLLYLEKFIEAFEMKDFLKEKEIQVFYSIAVMSACKMYEDRFYDNTDYYKYFNIQHLNISLKTFAAFERMFLKTLNYELLVNYKNLKDFIEIYSDEPNFVMDIVKSCKLAKLEIEKRLKK